MQIAVLFMVLFYGSTFNVGIDSSYGRSEHYKTSAELLSAARLVYVAKSLESL